MKISPIDISQKSFNKKLMGYGADEVQEFLRIIADEFEDVIHKKNHLSNSLREKEMHLMEYREREDMLKNTIATASQMADRIKKDADKEADLIIREAQQKANLIIQNSKNELNSLFKEIAELKKMRLQFEANIKALAQAHLSLIEEGTQYFQTPDQTKATSHAPQNETCN